MGLGRLKQKLHLGRSKPNTNHLAANANDVAPANEKSPPESSKSTTATATDQPHELNRASDVPIRELWNLAYEKLREEDAELVQRYETELNVAGGRAALETKDSRREQMDAVLRGKVDEVTRDAWKLKFGSSEVPIRDLAGPVLSVLDSANDYITGAVNGNPYASIAWSGVSLLLPLLLNPSEQAASLASGLQYIASLIVQSRMWEDLYVRRYEDKTGNQESSPVSHAEYKSALEELYRRILAYQIKSYCHYTRNSAFRLGLDMVKWDDWGVDDIREQEGVFTAVSTIWRDMKYDEECEATERRHQESISRWETITLDVQGLRKAVEDAQQNYERQALLDWLSGVDPSTTYNIAREKHESGTGEWLLDSDEFQAWQQSPCSLLWLHGKAGSGKSVLSSSVIQYLRDEYAHDPETALAYFYFSFADSQKQKTVEMLASLVKQLCCCRPDTPQPVKDLAKYKERGEHPDIKTLEAVLIATMRGFSAVDIVIDGLDECPALSQERGKLLNSLRRILAAAPDTVHILCTSRREPDIDVAFRPLLSPPARDSIDLEAYRAVLDHDIGLYIDATLASDEYSSWTEAFKSEVRDQLIEKADGMFQYIACQFDELRRLSSVGKVRKALYNLPAGLDATYDRMLLNLDPEFQQPVASMLKWLCFSRVLKLDELAEIFVLHPEETTILDESERLFNSRDVLKYLGGFVVESDDDVLLAHFSIKEYLTSQRVSQGPASAFAFSEEDARFHIAHTCLIYHLDVTRTDNLNMWGTLEDPGPLSECAVWEWAPHLERLPYESWPVHVVAAARRALAPGSSSLAYIARCHLRFEDFAGAVKRGQPPHRLTLRLGFRQVTEMLISTDEYLIQEDLDRALQEAVHAGDSSMVEMLLDRGADVNGEAEPWGSALHAAATEGHAELVGLLLDKGAAINAHPLGRVGSALQAAAAENRLDIVKLLVARDAEICTEGVCGVALGARAYQSHEMLVLLLDKGTNNTCKHNTAPHEVVRSLVRRYDGERSLELLLARGFDLNALGGEDYGYPVHWACRTGELYDVQHVLGKGADIHAVGGRFGSVMQAASSSNVRGAEDDCPILEYLQEQGADVNARGGRYGTALQAACYNSTYKDTTPDFSDSMEGTVDLYISALRAAELRVQMLLDYGADVNASGGIYDNALQAAALGEYDSMSDGVLGMLLNRGANVNKKGGKYGTALQAAAAVGNAKNVQSLLDHGAEVNAEGGEYGTALQAACSLGRDFRWSRAAEGSAYDTARLLLDSGADVHIQGGRFGDAWHAAAGGPTRYNTTSNWKELMQLLLDEGVDVNDARGRLPYAPTALHAVVQTCSDVSEKLDFLLEHGADPNLTAGTYGTLLQAACAARDDDGHTIDSEDAVRALLDRQRCSDMDVNAQGGLFGCALQAAAYSGQTATIRLLLDAGADVNLRGGKYGSALNASVVKGYWDDVELLLEAGAEPDCWSLPEIDREWLGRVREEDGRGAAERYEKFWERQLEKRAG